jgi:DNA-directed RNA polymerase II subunit RPB4
MAEELKKRKVLMLYRMLMKTTDYLDHFARFKRKENVEAVERLLSAHRELAKFERAQLGMFAYTIDIK